MSQELLERTLKAKELLPLRLERFKELVNLLNIYDRDKRREVCRQWGKLDLFFLLVVLMRRRDACKQWILDRCREIEKAPNGYIDLWARGHYKSTIITFALTIQEIIRNADIKIGIFSHIRPIAKSFLRQIKEELETNEDLKYLYSDILYGEPRRESVKWSEDDGIVVKRKTNSKESTVEAWGVVDGQPTGKHFDILLYDDLVTLESVTTAEQIRKTTENLKLSFNLASANGVKRFIGTRYSAGDTYEALINEGTVKTRIYPATDNGKTDGAPVLLGVEELAAKRREMGVYIFNCQMLQNPIAEDMQEFKMEWLRYYDTAPKTADLNRYLICDPAGEKKANSDYSVMAVIGLGKDSNYYLLAGIRDRLNLTERTKTLMKFQNRFLPKKTGYEKYGKDSDIEHIKYIQAQETNRFEIISLSGRMPKNDRIRKLIPIFEAGRFWMPRNLPFIDIEGKAQDFIVEMISEYRNFPRAIHDDIIDCIARILDEDLEAKFPQRARTDEIIDDGKLSFW